MKQERIYEIAEHYANMIEDSQRDVIMAHIKWAIDKALEEEAKIQSVVLPSDGEIINKIDLLTDNQANFANEKGIYSPSRAFDTLREFIKWTRTERR